MSKVLELVRPSNEVRFAIDFDENTDVSDTMNVGFYDPLVSGSRGFFRDRRKSPFAKNLDCAIEVSFGLFERAFAVHDSGLRSFPQVSDGFGRYRAHGKLVFLPF